MKPSRALLAVLLAACDNSQAVHSLDPDLNRMMVQPRGEAYEATDAFEDGTVMRVPPRGTIRFGQVAPGRPAVTPGLLVRGRGRFEVFCAACHGMDGSGESVVATKMAYRPPPSLHEPRLRALSAESLVRIVTEGYGLMPSYAAHIEPADRWAVAFYVQALQLSRGARASELPPDVRASLEEALR